MLVTRFISRVPFFVRSDRTRFSSFSRPSSFFPLLWLELRWWARQRREITIYDCINLFLSSSFVVFRFICLSFTPLVLISGRSLFYFLRLFPSFTLSYVFSSLMPSFSYTYVRLSYAVLAVFFFSAICKRPLLTYTRTHSMYLFVVFDVLMERTEERCPRGSLT